ncbi:hypothetical protein [Catenulispora pinisilvae]|uniref:hypothetical protein n=1 Tax=Catenulispora pinisilvae TaxID=2705253 RepID=UPI00189265F8|nr:hypothetical protein [Catenulispora pinisilvae]
MADAEVERVRRALWLDVLAANSEPERAVLRCALNILSGARTFEIDPVTGTAYTVAAFEQAAVAWAEQHAEYDRHESPDTDWYRHQLALEGRAVQAKFATFHPHLAEPRWFPGHGPRSCVFCLMVANEAAGLPVESGIDPVTGGVATPEPVVLVTDPERASTTATTRWERGTAQFAGRDYSWQIGYQVRADGREHEFSVWAGTTVTPQQLALPRWERTGPARECHGGTSCCCVSIGHADRARGIDWHLRWTDAAGDAIESQWFDDGMHTSARDLITLMIHTGPWAERQVPVSSPSVGQGHE